MKNTKTNYQGGALSGQPIFEPELMKICLPDLFALFLAGICAGMILALWLSSIGVNS